MNLDLLSHPQLLGPSIQFFNFAAAAYLLSTVAYVIHLARRSRWSWLLGVGAAAAGVTAQTVGLALRWISMGWDHPPFTNMYESLVFFAWGIVLVYLVVEWRHKVRVAGAFVIPLAFVAMGVASLQPGHGVRPLMPALQSVWLHIHVATAGIGYAAFLVAFGFSLLYLYKVRTRLVGFGLTTSLVGAAVAAMASSLEIFDRSGQGICMPANSLIAMPGELAMVSERWVPIHAPGPWLLGAFALFLFAAAAFGVSRAFDNDQRSERVGWGVLGLALIALSAAAAVYVYVLNSRNDVGMSGNPYRLAMLLVGWLAVVLVFVLKLSSNGLREALPDAQRLDMLSYRAVVVAFPIMTLVIVTGAVWANVAWGTYWSWDPKETSSLITWLIYAIYLHTRVTQGWTGVRTAYISIIGFLSVLFTYLGVNLLIAGLHAYA
ncbi:MAG: cytochrome c biogenesis protein CcsA [Candidatus Alcyoniella australis]|nr:cytochrome c biogenesis protein CcsA [Candidatus Alcyoniella australis]